MDIHWKRMTILKKSPSGTSRLPCTKPILYVWGYGWSLDIAGNMVRPAFWNIWLLLSQCLSCLCGHSSTPRHTTCSNVLYLILNSSVFLCAVCIWKINPLLGPLHSLISAPDLTPDSGLLNTPPSAANPCTDVRSFPLFQWWWVVSPVRTVSPVMSLPVHHWRAGTQLPARTGCRTQCWNRLDLHLDLGQHKVLQYEEWLPVQMDHEFLL